MTPESQSIFVSSSHTPSSIVDLFTNLPCTMDQPLLENQFRDPIREVLHRWNPSMFPMGHSMACIDDVIRFLFGPQQPICSTRLLCETCSSYTEVGIPFSFPFMLDPSMHDTYHSIHHTSPHIHSAV